MSEVVETIASKILSQALNRFFPFLKLSLFHVRFFEEGMYNPADSIVGKTDTINNKETSFDWYFNKLNHFKQNLSALKSLFCLLLMRIVNDVMHCN